MGKIWNSRLERRAQLKARGRRKKRLHALGFADGPLCRFVRGHRCCVPGCNEPGQPHHVDHAGLRLDWLPEQTADGLTVGLIGNVAPLCHVHHTELHDITGRPLFERDHDINLADVALWWGRAFERKHEASYRELVGRA